MGYADLQNSDAYVAKLSGAAVEILIVENENPAEAVIGAAANLNWNDNFSTNPVEEAGQDGVDEHTQGRHDGSLSISAFFTPERNDELPSRQDFIGREYTIFQRIAPGRAGAGEVLNVFVGAKINREGGGHGARGNMTVDLSFVYTRRYTGREWAELTGTL